MHLLSLLLPLPLVAAPQPEHDEPAVVVPAGMRAGWVVDTQQREAVRLFHRVRYRATPRSGFWQGSIDRCDAGETLPQHRQAALARINWFRAMAGVPADVEEDPAASRKTQAAALVMAANGRIAHAIDPGWRCHSDDAEEGARLSLLARGENGAGAVTAFMRDAGLQNQGVNHRRWLLYPQTRFIGLGDVPVAGQADAASGFTAYDGLYGSNRPAVRDGFVAWPPPGWVPYGVVFPRWSFALPGADFSEARIRMWQGDEEVAVATEALEVDVGEPTLVWRAHALAHDAAWTDRDGQYRVRIDRVKLAGAWQEYAYQVKLFDPEAAHATQSEAHIEGARRIPLAGGGFRVLPQPGATGAQWRALQVLTAGVEAGAEQGYGLFSYSGRNDYPVLDGKVVASGRQAYRLAHQGAGNETLTLSQAVMLGPAPRLRFMSRLGVAGRDEVALVEVLVDDRDDWETVYRQGSDGVPAHAEAQYRERLVDLSAYGLRRVQLRFRYQFDQGDFYTPDDSRVGWYIDDMQLGDAGLAQQITEPQHTRQGQFEFVPAARGRWFLQARPLVYQAAGDWGPLWQVHVE
ncbi:hypothetical protein GCM10007907_38080 [Chitinimonas prasina]|uniref:SCP domain-containing protein n=1 Tax=Chitinimonas prasina TaxID=1434937 RepID=A0ABQ5YM05_9NEIS|nr:CAP domain-containing protein [Chitinimonas prasina]GLR15018.1 hypothetical protein GCM10007907_38080 [Chitinimonas prasina]